MVFQSGHPILAFNHRAQHAVLSLRARDHQLTQFKNLNFFIFFFGIKIALVLTSRFRSLARAPAEEIKSRRDQTDSLEKGLNFN
jgi:hypothetical protein